MKKERKIVDTETHKEWKEQVGWKNLSVEQRIAVCEKEGLFDLDINDDPPTYELLPEDIDYERKKLSSKIKTGLANFIAKIGINHYIKKGMFNISSVEGAENFTSVKSGAIITCNHFGAVDSFIMQKVLKSLSKKRLFRVVLEGNYTNPPVLKFFLRNCNVLPLSSNKATMIKFMHAVNNILKKGDNILIYPEASMWPDYKKPRPLKDGAYKFAIKNDVPVIPIFITNEMGDYYNKKSNENVKIPYYSIHILEPIHADPNLNMKDNIQMMKKKNYDVWVKVYEETYKEKLTFTTDKDKMPEC